MGETLDIEGQGVNPEGVAKQTSRAKPAAAVDGAIARAADALASGGLVLMPTDTLPGLAAVWSLPAGLAALKRAAGVLGGSEGAPLPPPLAAWHAPDAATVRQALTDAGMTLAPLHGHAIDKLLPGPVTLRMERQPGEIEALRAALGVPAGLIDDGNALFVRVPGHVACQVLLSAVCSAEGAARPKGSMPVPVAYVAAIAVKNGRESAAATTMSEAADALAARKVEYVALDDEAETGLSRAAGVVSTLVTLTAGGGWALTRAGALSRREVEQRMRRTVLFVCTGNTCRSPMAQAIAKGLAEELILKIPTVFESAGTSGSDGGGYSIETRHAVAALGLVEPRGSARGVTKAMIDSADVIYAMTAGHRRALVAISPEAAGKVQLLDPSGKDIADPVGGPQTLYDSVAASMKVMLARRLLELEGTG